MKKIIIKSVVIIFVFSLILSSCTKNFEEINTNPNYPDIAPNESVLAYCMIELGDRFDISTEMEYAASYIGHITYSQNNSTQTYAAFPPVSPWTQYYVRILTNINRLIDEANDEEINLKATSMIIKAYATQLNVDMYGSMPYFEASRKDEGFDKPAFDSEEDIYTDMLEQLKTANDLLDENALKVGAGDVIYAGDVQLWKKFANSLRLRVAIRMSNIDETTAANVITEILNDPVTYPVFESNDDNAILRYPGEDWQDPWTRTATYKPYIRMAAPLVDTLVVLNDPRIAQYAADTIPGGIYAGIQVGELGGTASIPHDQFIANPDEGKVIFLTYSEVEFIKAEAFARNMATGDADAAYQKAIEANMSYYDIDATEISNYLIQPSVALNNDLNQIYIQKWISLFRQSWEAWAEMRRTDVPSLGIAVNSVFPNHNRPPVRFEYPEYERLLNSANIPNINIVDHYWGDQIWWDTRTGIQ